MKKNSLFYIGLLTPVIVVLIAAIVLDKEGDEININSVAWAQARFGRNLQVLTDVRSKEQLQKIMEGISDALGVKCNYCHDVNNYSSDIKETKKRARVMLKMVRTINRDFINWEGAEAVNCYTCHRGQAKPQTKGASK